MATLEWALDPTHSELQFKVKHLGISNVTGNLSVFSGSISSTDETFQNAAVSFSAEVASISTNNTDRDQHLKSADFFDAEQFPQITFTAHQFTASEGKITGDLTIKGVTKSVTFDVDFDGTAKDPWGNTKAGFSFQSKIKRSDFGLSWNATLETGGLLVSDEVRLQGEVQFVKPA